MSERFDYDGLLEVNQTLSAENARLREALEFYADPGSYHACSFIFDPPTGGFDDDFDEGHEGYERPMPGKCARAALQPERGRND